MAAAGTRGEKGEKKRRTFVPLRSYCNLFQPFSELYNNKRKKPRRVLFFPFPQKTSLYSVLFLFVPFYSTHSILPCFSAGPDAGRS